MDNRNNTAAQACSSTKKMSGLDFRVNSPFNLLILFCVSQSSAPWKGELCGEAQTLLELYATQNDLSPFLQDLA